MENYNVSGREIRDLPDFNQEDTSAYNKKVIIKIDYRPEYRAMPESLQGNAG
jgi:hypothetical protein